MKKVTSLVCLIAALCLCLSGCKSADYEQAVAFQESGDYAAALSIYETLDGYKDSAERITACNAMIAAIEEYNSAVVYAEEKNTELDSAISDAEKLIANAAPALDGTLAPALETAISECKAAKVEIADIPDTAEAIVTLAESLNTVDYSAVLTTLAEKKAALEESIQRYALVDAPSEAYIIECLLKVPNVLDVSAATEDNDPNGHLGKAGWYTAQVYFSCDLLDQSQFYGNTILDKGTVCGGSIEVYATVEDAENRNAYLASFDGTMFSSGSHTVIGTVIIRTSDELKASEQKELEANIISVLTSLEG